jgi:hypothetical protein
LILDDEFTYTVHEDDVDIGEVTFKVKMNELSEFYLIDCSGNKLYFNQTTSEFYFYRYAGAKSHLQELFKIAPKIPFINSNNISFTDYLPINIIRNSLQIKYAGFMAGISSKYAKEEVVYSYSSGMISSRFGAVSISSKNKFFSHIGSDNHILRIL